MGEELIPLFVRLSVEQAERLDRAVAAIDARKKDLVSGLIDRYVDPDSPTGLEALRALAGLGRGELVPAAAPAAAADALAPPTPSDADDPARPILTPAGAAALLGVRAVDVLELAAHAELPGRRVAGQWRFARAALIDWVAGGQPSSQRSASR